MWEAKGSARLLCANMATSDEHRELMNLAANTGAGVCHYRSCLSPKMGCRVLDRWSWGKTTRPNTTLLHFHDHM